MTATTAYQVDVKISGLADRGCLLKLVSVFHSRGIRVRDLHFADQADGRSTLSARFAATSTQSVLLRESLRRCVDVTHVEMAPGRDWVRP